MNPDWQDILFISISCHFILNCLSNSVASFLVLHPSALFVYLYHVPSSFLRAPWMYHLLSFFKVAIFIFLSWYEYNTVFCIKQEFFRTFFVRILYKNYFWTFFCWKTVNLIQKILNFIHFWTKSRHNFWMVPTRRIELRAAHYHCAVLPLYYVGLFHHTL